MGWSRFNHDITHIIVIWKFVKEAGPNIILVNLFSSFSLAIWEHICLVPMSALQAGSCMSRMSTSGLHRSAPTI